MVFGVNQSSNQKGYANKPMLNDNYNMELGSSSFIFSKHMLFNKTSLFYGYEEDKVEIKDPPTENYDIDIKKYTHTKLALSGRTMTGDINMIQTL